MPKGLEISEESLVDYVKNNLSLSQNSETSLATSRGFLMIDHRWQKSNGDFTFDSQRFKDVPKFIGRLR